MPSSTAPRVKSSGSRGLHVVVDVLDDVVDFDTTATFARRVAQRVVDRGPFTLEHRRAARRGRLLLDVFQNAIAKHTVAPYSLRALTRAPIAAPLHWDEALDASFHPQRITHDDIFRRLGQLDDPWAHVEPPSATIADAIDALDAQ